MRSLISPSKKGDQNMKLPYMKTFKFMIIFALLGILVFFKGHVRIGSAMLISAGILFSATVLLWLKWLLNL